jgi:transcriptional/translational regulatory protein YebC/TACO1
MGRAFEYRKATKMKRWGNMARVFTKLGKQITIAVREGGSEPDTNPRLRVLIQQSKKENMPKDNVERAIKKATSKLEVALKLRFKKKNTYFCILAMYFSMSAASVLLE